MSMAERTLTAPTVPFPPVDPTDRPGSLGRHIAVKRRDARVTRVLPSKPRRRPPLALIAVVVAALVLAAAIDHTIRSMGTSTFAMDGDMSDWADVPKFTDVVERAPDVHSDVDILEYAVAADSFSLDFYIKVGGRMMAGKASDPGADSLQAFLDTDRSASTGYTVHGIGADYLVQLQGWGGSLKIANLNSWDGPGGSDLVNFKLGGSVRCAVSDDELEAQVRLTDINVASRTSPVRCVLRMANSVGQEDWADAAVNQFPPALALRYTQPQTTGTINLLATAFHDDITLDRVTVRFEGHSGQPAVGQADIIANGVVHRGSGPGSSSVVSFAPPLIIPPLTQGVMLQVQTRSLGASVAVRPAILFSNDIEAHAVHHTTCEVSVRPAPGYTYLSTTPPPSGDIRIDGNFDDWAAIGGLAGEPMGDVKNYASATEPGYPYDTKNPNVDIIGYQVKLTPTGGPTHASFAIRTRGQMMAGLVVDNPAFPSFDTPHGGSGPAPDHMYLQDRAVIYIDRDPSNDPRLVTGVRVVAERPNFGADFYLDIAGKFGRVLPQLSRLYEFRLNVGWTEVTGFAISAATDFSSLETKVPLITLGMSPAVTPQVHFITTDWRGNYDETVVHTNR